MIAGSHSLAGTSTSRIQVIEDVLVTPPLINPNDSVGVDGTVAEWKMHITESEAPYLYGFENGESIFLVTKSQNLIMEL